jgi:hypothetical protein
MVDLELVGSFAFQSYCTTFIIWFPSWKGEKGKESKKKFFKNFQICV